MIRRPMDSRILPVEAETIPLPRLETTPPVMKMYLGILLLQSCLRQLQVFGRVDAHRLERRLDHPDTVSVLERPQLLELFFFFQIGRREFFEFEQKILRVGIDADVLVEPVTAGCRLRERGDGRAREIER